MLLYNTWLPTWQVTRQRFLNSNASKYIFCNSMLLAALKNKFCLDGNVAPHFEAVVIDDRIEHCDPE